MNNSRAKDNDTPHILEFKKLKMDTDRLEVSFDNQTINLTRTEFLILQCLLENKNHVVSREQIFQYAWGPEHYVDDNSVDVYIRYIRSKVDERFKETIISTVRGAGYSIKD
jgi:two-component system response regulator ArlR